MNRIRTKDFYEIQKEQWEKSLLLLSLLVVFYFAAVGLISFALLASFGLILAKPSFFSQEFLAKFFLANLGLAVVITIFHFIEARKFGASFILKRLGALPPDLSDLYHKQFVNAVEGIRISSGLPRVKTYILPTLAINSLALIESDHTPCVAASEGLLADCTRDELEAVAAHELAHIARGDSFYLTLVCSLANIFERLRETLEPDDEFTDENFVGGQSHASPSPLLHLAATVSAIVMHLLSLLISRQREILADAAAVEFGRNPAALARAIYKAHVKNSFIGDFNQTYSPLFIVPPESRGESDDFFSRMISSHPPLMMRIRMLAAMADIPPEDVVEQVLEMQKNREQAKRILPSSEEIAWKSSEIPADGTEKSFPDGDKVWLTRPPKRAWQGPYSLEELLFLPHFAPFLMVQNIQEGIEAQAREFPQIRAALLRIVQKKPVNAARKNRCPRCAVSLTDGFYEGVPVKFCNRCRGRLVDSRLIERIIARREIGFSRELLKKAEDFKQRFLLNPIKTQKITAGQKLNFFCPNCGYKMMPRPFNYQYFIPVDKCLSCYKIWFDADELEVLQILIEKPAPPA
ncbi:MAG: zinc metalloprotease HtpX [Candidatus Aminicenantales bacterium]